MPEYGGDSCEGNDHEIQFCDDCQLVNNCGFQLGFYDLNSNIQTSQGEDEGGLIENCQEQCQANDECHLITVLASSRQCYLLPEQENPIEYLNQGGSISGPKYCSVNGGWSEFSNWTECSADSCTTSRSRTCNNPTPQYGGSNCQGLEQEIKYCLECTIFPKNCAQLANYQEEDQLTAFKFSDIKSSALECQRKCQESDKCSGFVMNLQEQVCILKSLKFENLVNEHDEQWISGPKNCPQNGNWTDFTTWTSCKNQQRKGFRFCTNPKPDHGGEDCKGDHFIIETCSEQDESKREYNHADFFCSSQSHSDPKTICLE